MLLRFLLPSVVLLVLFLLIHSSSVSPFASATTTTDPTHPPSPPGWEKLPAYTDNPEDFNVIIPSCAPNATATRQNIPLIDPVTKKKNVILLDEATTVRTCTLEERVPLIIGPDVHVDQLLIQPFPTKSQISLCGLEITGTTVETHTGLILSFFKNICASSPLLPNRFVMRDFHQKTYQIYVDQIELENTSTSSPRYQQVQSYFTKEEKENGSLFLQNQMLQSFIIEDSTFVDRRGLPGKEVQEAIIRLFNFATRTFIFRNNLVNSLASGLLLRKVTVLDLLLIENNVFIGDDRDCPESHCWSPEKLTGDDAGFRFYSATMIQIWSINIRDWYTSHTAETIRLLPFAQAFAYNDERKLEYDSVADMEERYRLVTRPFLTEKLALTIRIQHNTISSKLKAILNHEGLLTQFIAVGENQGSMTINNNNIELQRILLKEPDLTRAQIIARDDQLGKNYRKETAVFHVRTLGWFRKLSLHSNSIDFSTTGVPEMVSIRYCRESTEGILVFNNTGLTSSDSDILFAANFISFGPQLENLPLIAAQNNTIKFHLERTGIINNIIAQRQRFDDVGAIMVPISVVEILSIENVTTTLVADNIIDSFTHSHNTVSLALSITSVANSISYCIDIGNIIVRNNSVVLSGTLMHFGISALNPRKWRNVNKFAIEDNVIDGRTLTIAPLELAKQINRELAYALKFDPGVLVLLYTQLISIFRTEVVAARHVRISGNIFVFGNVDTGVDFPCVASMVIISPKREGTRLNEDLPSYVKNNSHQAELIEIEDNGFYLGARTMTQDVLLRERSRLVTSSSSTTTTNFLLKKMLSSSSLEDSSPSSSPSFFKSNTQILSYGPMTNNDTVDEPRYLGLKALIVRGNEIISVTANGGTWAPVVTGFTLQMLKLRKNNSNNNDRADDDQRDNKNGLQIRENKIAIIIEESSRNTLDVTAPRAFLVNSHATDDGLAIIDLTIYAPNPPSRFIVFQGNNNLTGTTSTTTDDDDNDNDQSVAIIENNNISFGAAAAVSSAGGGVGDSLIVSCEPSAKKLQELRTRASQDCFGMARRIDFVGNTIQYYYCYSSSSDEVLTNRQKQMMMTFVNVSSLISSSSTSSRTKLVFSNNSIKFAVNGNDIHNNCSVFDEQDLSQRLQQLKQNLDDDTYSLPKSISFLNNNIEFEGCSSTIVYNGGMNNNNNNIQLAVPDRIVFKSNTINSRNTEQKSFLASIHVLPHQNSIRKSLTFVSNILRTDAKEFGSFFLFNVNKFEGVPMDRIFKIDLIGNSFDFDSSSSLSSSSPSFLYSQYRQKLARVGAVSTFPFVDVDDSVALSELLSAPSNSNNNNKKLILNTSVSSSSTRTHQCNILSLDKSTRVVNPDFTNLNISSSSTISLLLDASHGQSSNNKNKCAFFNITRFRTRTLTNTSLPLPPHSTPPTSSSHDPGLSKGSTVTQSVSMLAAATSASVVPSMGFGVARQQAMLNFIQGMRDNDCSGVAAVDGVAAADSPTQMEIGASEARYFIGGAVGNVLLCFGLVFAAQIAGTFYLKKTGSSSWNKPFSVFARCHVATVYFVCASLLFAPTVNFGLTVVALESPKFVSSIGEKVLTFIFAIILFALPVVWYTVWALYKRDRKETYHISKSNNNNNNNNSKKETSSQKSCKQRIEKWFSYWFEGPGEWKMPLPNTPRYIKNKITIQHQLEFDAATPLLDGYQGHVYYFGAVEFAVQLGLALASFFAQVVPSEKSCVTLGAILIVVLSVFLILTLYCRPFQEKFNRIAIPIVTGFEIAIIAIALYFKDIEQPEWLLAIAMVTVSMQSAMAVLVLLASLSPLFKQVMKVVRRLKARGARGGKGGGQKRREGDSFWSGVVNSTNLRSLLGGDEVHEEGGSNGKKRKTDRHDEQEIELRNHHRRRSSSASPERRPHTNARSTTTTRPERRSSASHRRDDHHESVRQPQQYDTKSRRGGSSSRGKPSSSAAVAASALASFSSSGQSKHQTSSRDSSRNNNRRNNNNNNNNNNSNRNDDHSPVSRRSHHSSRTRTNRRDDRGQPINAMEI